MSARTKARKRAIDAVYAADLRKVSPLELLALTEELASDRQNQEPQFSYAKQIVEGVVAHHEEIDDLLETYSQGWALERMPNVDRAILRVGCWEILFGEETPDAVAIAEAVAIAKDLSTDESGSFINGLLGRIAATRQAK